MAESESIMKNTVTDISIADLIAAPLQAASDAQLKLARSTIDFINEVGVEDFGDDTKKSKGQAKKIRNLTFKMESPREDGGTNGMDISAPLLALVPLPNLAVEEVDVDFQMEVTSTSKSVESNGESGVTVCGKVTSSVDQTRETNHSAKYHIKVKAARQETPEGLSRIFDLMAAVVQGQPSVEKN